MIIKDNTQSFLAAEPSPTSERREAERNTARNAQGTPAQQRRGLPDPAGSPRLPKSWVPIEQNETAGVPHHKFEAVLSSPHVYYESGSENRANLPVPFKLKSRCRSDENPASGDDHVCV